VDTPEGPTRPPRGRNRRARAVADRAASLEPRGVVQEIAISQHEPASRPRGRVMTPPQRRRATFPRRAGRRARPPRSHEATGRSHPLGTPRNPTQAARASRGVSTRVDRQVLIDRLATSSLLPPMPRDVFQRSARVVRASWVESCNARFEILPEARRRARPRDCGQRVRFCVLGASARRLTGESPVRLIV